jgi:putative membrane protein
MKAFTKGLLLAALAMLMHPLAARAEDRPIVERKTPDKEPTTDQEFLIKAITANIAEIRFGEKTLKESDNKDVRNFAKMMIDDHTKIKDDLMKVAKGMKLAVVEGLEKNTREEMARLSKLKGADYDREYMQCMVQEHEKASKLFHTWAKKASDSELREISSKGATKADEHLRRAKEIVAKLKGS